MDEDPAGGVRRKKDSSLVRAAELVRDGKASRHGVGRQHRGDDGLRPAADGPPARGRAPVHRHAAAPPGRTPAVLVDAGANAECTAAMLVQFAQMGAAYVSARFGTESPSVGLLSIGEEPTKGTPLVKETHGSCWPTIASPGTAAGGDPSSSSATSRAATCCPRRPTWS